MEMSARVLWGTTGAIAASTALLPSVSGYGTTLSQTVILGSWTVVSHLVSPQFADQHDGAIWTVATFVNCLLFFVPAWLVFVTTRTRRPRLGAVLLLLWCGFYLASLFVLFPAIDGP